MYVDVQVPGRYSLQQGPAGTEGGGGLRVGEGRLISFLYAYHSSGLFRTGKEFLWKSTLIVQGKPGSMKFKDHWLSSHKDVHFQVNNAF